MTFSKTVRSDELLSDASSRLKDALEDNGSTISKTADEALESVLRTMALLLHGHSQDSVYQLASLDPGSGKTEAVCAFLRAWKEAGFVPSNGALIVLSTRKEIETCIARSSLQPCDFAVLVQKDHPMNDLGSLLPDAAPVLFTTQEKLRRECDGRSFAETTSFHFRGRPRLLRVWDEAFLPATPTTLRKDLVLQPLADLRPTCPDVAASLDSLGASLSADTVGQVVEVPNSAYRVHKALSGLLEQAKSDNLAGLKSLAGREAVVVSCNSRGLHLAGGTQAIPEDFAPALILDASGRVRETYRTMETAGLLERLPSAATDYRNLRVHHWNRAASRSTLDDPKARQEVLKAVASAINQGGDEEPWLVIYAKDRGTASYNIVQNLQALVDNPSRLSWLHWGNHHGTNDYRDIRKVAVIGLWHQPQPTYSALHVAAGGSMDLATDKATLDALKAGEHRHNLLQAICRASVRKGTDGACGDCEVFLVGRLGPDGRQLLLDTFPGAIVDAWTPAGHELTGSALRVALELERALAEPGVQRVQKAALRASLGLQTGEALAKVLRREDFKAWAVSRGIRMATRTINLGVRPRAA